MNPLKTSSKANLYRIHIAVWIVLAIYESIITVVISGKFWTPLDYFNAYFINFFLFYVNAHFVLPRIYKKPFYILAGGILAEMAVYIIIKYLISAILHSFGLGPDPLSNQKTVLSYTIWRFFYFIGLSTGYWFALNIIRQRKEISDLEKNRLLSQLENERLEKQLAESEIAYLKAQINPHFLFNTLNFLYNSSLKNSRELSEPIMLLSDIMRYALTETPQSGMVLLEDEIDQINTFINLNQLRFDHNLQLFFNVSGNVAGCTILPLILLTPIENIFKYGDLKNVEHPATIQLNIENNHLHLRSSNRKLRSKRHIPSGGVGLKNLKLRLDAYYSDAHNIKVSENEEDYIFELDLTL